MSTPQPPPSRGSRRSSRRPKHSTLADNSEPDQTQSDSNPSPPDIILDAPEAVWSPTKHVGEQSNKRKSQGPKRTQNGPKSERPPSHHHAPSPPDFSSSTQRQATPVKQAYAGPTFHASPAPSALPLPSFYSKSMPSVSRPKTPDIIKRDIISEKDGSLEQFDLVDAKEADLTKRESTPLDFLFEAARQARETPSRTESPGSRLANISALEHSPIRRSPARREASSENVFPFELEGNGSDATPIGPSFATPYKERMNLLHPANSTPNPSSQDLDEDERRAKTEALKRLLMNAHPQRAASTSPRPTMNNPFNARALETRHSDQALHQIRHRSGPSTPTPYSGHRNASAEHPHYPSLPQEPHDIRQTGPPIHRPASSHLRREYQPGDGESPAELSSENGLLPPPISTARRSVPFGQPPYPVYGSQSMSMPRASQIPSRQSAQSTQQMEDDLRRVLKLDVTSSG